MYYIMRNQILITSLFIWTNYYKNDFLYL